MVVPEKVYQEYHNSLKKVQDKVESIKIEIKNDALRKSWGRAVAACDCLDDAYDAILEFDFITNMSYYARRPILYYYGILQAFSIQVKALNQLREFFCGQKNCEVTQKQNNEKTKNVVDIRNDIVHSCDRNSKESCFIAKQIGMPKETLWYGEYDTSGNFSEANIDLSNCCLSQMQSTCEQLKIFSSIPKDQIFFYLTMQKSNN